MQPLVLAAIPWSARSLAEQISLTVHISAGSVAIISGFIAMFARKGGAIHRKNGIVFAVSMLVMGWMGAFVAVVFDRAFAVNFPAGLIVTYWVATAYATVNEDSRFATRPWAVAFLIVGFLIGAYNATLALYATATGRNQLMGLPLFPYFFFGILGLLAAYGDWRVLRFGPLTGSRRLTRHLWRMNLSLFIAAGSFFLGQAKVIPKPMRIWPLLFIPPLLTLASVLYWLWRVRLRNSLRGMTLAQLQTVRTEAAS